jgi:hypothetical protein
MYNKPNPKPKLATASPSNQVLLRIVGLYAAIVVISLFLGIGIFFILFGFVQVGLWFSNDWEPAYWMSRAMLGIPPNRGGFSRRPRNVWRATLIVIKAGVILYCLYLGFSILSRGFLEQNIIYLLMRD